MAKTENETAATPAETKAEKFKRLAEARVSKALSAIAVIGGLASKTNYDYTDEQVAKIIGALNAEIEVLGKRFAKPDSVAKGGFSL
jgi:menaquinone-dependent protoporphyrinogen IX oxidase